MTQDTENLKNAPDRLPGTPVALRQLRSPWRLVRLRPTTAVSAAIAAVYGCLGFAIFVQCGPKPGGWQSGGVLYGAPDQDSGEATTQSGSVAIYPGSPDEPSFSSGIDGGPVRPRQTPLDPEFCKGFAYGQCLTLVVRIPAAQLQVDPGLSTLNLMQAAPTWQGLFERACSEGLLVGLPNAALSGPGRNRVLGKVIKSRCVIQSLSDETTPLPQLASQELGFAARLVDFRLVSGSSGTAPAVGRITFEQSKIDFKFHDAQVFGQGRWQPIRGAMNLWNVLNYSGVFGTAHAGIRFNERLTFVFNGPGAVSYLNSVLSPILDAAKRGQGLGEIGAEIAVIKQAVTALAAGSNPVVPTLILVAVAVDAVRDLCTHRASDCRITGTESNVGDEILQRLGSSQVVTSETRASLIDGLKNLPFAVLQAIFRHANLGDMERSLNLPTKPFWVMGN